MKPTQSTLKRLFALSGNRCAFPKCQAPLTHNDTLLGEVCHIKADSPGGPRYDAAQTADERQHFGNLIVMCPTHHTVIDDDEISFSVSRLQQIKTDHESVATALEDAKAEHIAALYLGPSYVSVGQTGGLSAQNIHAQTIYFNNAQQDDPLVRARQLDAIATVWQIVRQFREEFGDLILIDSILTADEIEECFNGSRSWPRSFGGIEAYSAFEMPMQKINRAGGNKLEQYRPFIPPRVWSVAYIIRALHGRVAYLYHQSFEKHAYQDWRKDSGADQLLRYVLPSNVVVQLRGQTINALQGALDHLEEYFLTEAKMRGG
jgi:hypothetical protein